jgi:hypothetical protein
MENPARAAFAPHPPIAGQVYSLANGLGIVAKWCEGKEGVADWIKPPSLPIAETAGRAARQRKWRFAR